MAGVRFAAKTAPIVTGTSLKTLVQLLAATNVAVDIETIEIAFNGVVNTDAPILVELLKQTDAGTMSALTLSKMDGRDSETLQVTAQHTSTGEPSAGTVIYGTYVHPQTGWVCPMCSKDNPLHLKGAERLGLRVTAGVSVSAQITITGRE